MKKSDMLEMIEAELYVYSKYEQDIHRQVARMILRTIEDVGMLPPYTEEANIWDCEWEPEDD
jgi:hypothetical protein